MNYYNEWDTETAKWLRNLIARDLIPHGIVDTRNINDIEAGELERYTSCHFFAGIGGWPLALRMAGWPDNRPVWTGSCPCQPFSSASHNRKGFDDERHLWPKFYQLIRHACPTTIFGEQVASADGRIWFHHVRNDLEKSGYAVGCAHLRASGIGRKHQRKRQFFVADAGNVGLRKRNISTGTDNRVSSFRGQAPGDNTLLSETQYTPIGDKGLYPSPSGVFPLAHGLSAYMERVRSRLRDIYKNQHHHLRVWRRFRELCDIDSRHHRTRIKGYGNAIVPELASVFIQSFMDLDVD